MRISQCDDCSCPAGCPRRAGDPEQAWAHRPCSLRPMSGGMTHIEDGQTFRMLQCRTCYRVVRENLPALACHARVFSGEMHPTHAPAWFWICSRCGEMGTERLRDRPQCDATEFWNLAVRFGRETREGADRMIAMMTRAKGSKS
jgi:hypothetical protein